jgi:signal recognition particle GTPase
LTIANLQAVKLGPLTIVAIGVGEQIDDLNAFSPKEFARNLLF